MTMNNWDLKKNWWNSVEY